MVVNIAKRYLNQENSKNEFLVNFVRKMDVEILGFGYRTNQEIQSLQNFMLPNFLLVYLCNGGGRLVHNEQTVDLQAGSMYLINPFELYTGIKAHELDYMYIYFDIHPVSVKGILQRIAFKSRDELFQRPWTKKLKPILQELHISKDEETFHQYFLLQEAVYSLIANVLYEQMSFLDEKDILGNIKDNNLVDQAFAYTDNHMNELLDIGLLAKNFGTSRSSLNRVFMKIFADPPLKVLTRFKMRKALELMKNGSSVKETAKAVGYSSTFHFSRIFKTTMGKSPTEYMKQ